MLVAASMFLLGLATGAAGMFWLCNDAIKTEGREWHEWHEWQTLDDSPR